MTVGEHTFRSEPPESADGFGSTAWSLVLAASRSDNDGPALNRLCRKYWKPVYTYARRSGLPAADAEDVTQDFFAYFLERSWLKQANPERGSFRAFLLTLFRNFLANHRRRQRALKRNGSEPDLPFDGESCERELAAAAPDLMDPAAAYDRAWANCVLQTTLERLAHEQAGAGKALAFEKLRPFLTQRPGAGDYETLAAELGVTRNQITLLIHRLSRRFAELLRIEVSDTVAGPAQVDAELHYLLTTLTRT
jgi:RNA polymerase sigma-70 factor (ECF subfamily)